jgi:biotin operon repressor
MTLILEDRRISAKSIAEQLGISREWVGFIVHKDLDMLVDCTLTEVFLNPTEGFSYTD